MKIPALKSESIFFSSTLIFSILFLCPIIALFIISANNSDDIWEHLFETVLFKYVYNTIILMVGVIFLSLFISIIPAWLVSNYDFKFAKFFDWILVLPIACPAYLVAYAYTDFLEYSGPVQKFVRFFFSYNSADEYFFPEIRSLWGAIFVMSFVLYPYIYVLARTAFRKAPLSLYETSRLYNKSTFFSVGLPLARPAIFAGIALVCMEVVSDFGTVEYFSLETLTLGIFNVWIGMNSITSAAQLSIITFIFVISLLLIEIKSRASSKFHDTSRRKTFVSLKKLNSQKSILCILICLFPPFVGFIIPVLILISNSLYAFDYEPINVFLKPFLNSILVSFLSAAFVVLISFLIVSYSNETKSKFVKTLAGISSTGYAFPGTMLAIGVVIFIGFLDNLINSMDKFILIIPNNLYFGGTFFVLLFAYIVRFQAIGFGSLSSGFQKIPQNLFFASRCLGKTFLGTTIKVTLPLLLPFLIAGGLLVFVDVMKELPMTLLLRPFNFETLATQTYQYAHSELMAEASIPALMIVSSGLIPVFFMNKLLRDI
jgi:iron(III) transport system permease protein